MKNPAPTDLAVALSPEWLSEVLSTKHPGTRVESIDIVERQKTMASKIRFTVRYRSGTPPGAPGALCLKGFFGHDPDAKPSSGENEARFYRDLAATLPVRLPNCLYVGLDPSNQHGLLLMEDMVPAGTKFLSALEPYTVAQAEGTLDQLARLHASHWGGQGLEATPWIESRLAFFANFTAVPAPALEKLLSGKRGDPLPAEVKNGERIYRAIRALTARSSSEPACLVHGDAHAGNVFETKDGPGFVDWQLVQRESWALDVAYHIGAALTVEERERSEERLLRHYLDRLREYLAAAGAAGGAAAPSWEDAWLRYRIYLLYGYYLWGITRKVVEPVILEFVKRLGTAVVRHRSFELLGV